MSATLRQAQALATRLPKLILEAERLAFIAAPGLHGRRRGGQGDSFWQFRDWQNGDDARRIDWRRSAQGDRLFLREREWEAQASVALALEDTQSLDFQSHPSLPTKRERAILLLLALAAILLRAGERVSLVGATPPVSGNLALQTIAAALLTRGSAGPDPQARLVRFGDFLPPIPSFASPPGGAALHILDPAECDFPYNGRIIFEFTPNQPGIEAPQAENWAETYRGRMAAHRAAITQAALKAGQTPLFHRTDHPPATALAALYQALLRR
jgi:uncharacterized protein (DUF58 family)